MSDVIFAQATGAGRAGIAIVRMSGSNTGELLDRLTRPRPAPRRATVRRLHDANGEMLDVALVLWFPGPGSYTGEDCAELHVHGGPAVIEAVAEALRCGGGRPAEAGEFTQRAFVNGRLDLIEAEGIVDLIDAETDSQRRQALAQSGGALSDLYHSWSARLTQALAVQEASIDFPDETNETGDQQLVAEMAELGEEIGRHLANGAQGELLRRGLVIAVVGAPNVGKSSLVNALARRDVAMVSERPGTTRDVVQTRMVVADVPVTLVDTAGIRDSNDELEREGVKRAKAAAADADILLAVTCGDEPAPSVADTPTVWVANKIDLLAAPTGAVAVSALTGEGLTTLRDNLEHAARRLVGRGCSPMMTRARHRDCLQRAAVHLAAARLISSPELRGEELRLAAHNLGRLTGAVAVDDVLDVIFSTFCVGK